VGETVPVRRPVTDQPGLESLGVGREPLPEVALGAVARVQLKKGRKRAVRRDPADPVLKALAEVLPALSVDVDDAGPGRSLPAPGCELRAAHPRGRVLDLVDQVDAVEGIGRGRRLTVGTLAELVGAR